MTYGNLGNRVVKRVLVAFAVLALLFVGAISLTSCGESGNNAGSSSDNATTQVGRSVQQIKDAGEIKIGVFSDKAPFGYTDANGGYAGYDVVFANRIAEDLGVKVEFVPTEAAARVPSLESKKVDVILANFTVTDERKEKVDFALPYMRVALGIVSKTGEPVESLDNYTSDKPLILVKGTTAQTYIDKHYPNLNILKFDQYNDAQNALLDGRGSGWITDNTEAIAFAKNNSGFVVPEAVANVGDQDTIAPAVTKGNTDLLNWINDEIKKLGEEKFFHKDYEQTLTEIYGSEFEDLLVVEGGKL